MGPRERPTFRPNLEALEDRCVPSTLTVTKVADGGAGSLRYEIGAAHNGDTITFASWVDGGTITLNYGELYLRKDVKIQGPEAGLLTISGNQSSRVFDVAAGVHVALSGLMIAKGWSFGPTMQDYMGMGSGIFNAGTLTMSGCTVSNMHANYGGGIYNTGTLTVSDCTLNGDSATNLGGAIDNASSGDLTIATASCPTTRAASSAAAASTTPVRANPSLMGHHLSSGTRFFSCQTVLSR